MLILGLESSCDETAAALVTGDRRILAHKLAGQEAAHAPYGGVVPEIAARAHVEVLDAADRGGAGRAGVTLADVDAIAATAGPGLIGGVMVGLVTGKALALAAGKPLIAVNHLEGHALTPAAGRSRSRTSLICCCWSRAGIASCCRSRASATTAGSATTIDDAAGEAFDKTAKTARPRLSRRPGGRARGGARAIRPRCRCRARCSARAEPHFSFAGLKSAVLRAQRRGRRGRREDIAASFQQAAVDCLVDRTARGDWREADGATALGRRRRRRGQQRGARGAAGARRGDTACRFVAPPLWLCTDNAAMIAWAGAERFAAGLTDPLDVAGAPALAARSRTPRRCAARG